MTSRSDGPLNGGVRIAPTKWAPPADAAQIHITDFSALEQAAFRILTVPVELRSFQAAKAMSRGPARTLPDWPAMLSRDQLCDYLGVSWSTLKGILTVSPVDLGANVIRYRRDQIDEWVKSRPPRAARGRGPRPEPQAPCAETPEQDSRLLALERARQRLEAR